MNQDPIAWTIITIASIFIISLSSVVIKGIWSNYKERKNKIKRAKDRIVGIPPNP